MATTTPEPVRTPEPYLAARIEKVRHAMKAAKVPALLITSFVDVSWLTGFEGDDSYVLLTRDQLLLLRYLLRQIVRSPLKFLFPVDRDTPPVSILTAVPEEK